MNECNRIRFIIQNATIGLLFYALVRCNRLSIICNIESIHEMYGRFSFEECFRKCCG